MRLLFLALLLTAPSVAADAERDARWTQDLDYLATQLPQRHVNAFHDVSQADFNRAVSELRAAIPSLSDVEIMVGMAAIVALVGDAHTSLGLSSGTSTFHMLPLRVLWFADGLFVTSAGSEYAKALGAKILRIGDRSVDEAYQAVSKIISHENDPWVRESSPNYLVNADVLQALKIAPDARSVHFVFGDQSGSRFEMDMSSLDPGQPSAGVTAPDPQAGSLPLYRQQQSQNYWFTYIGSSRTLYFAYNQCAEMSNLPFAQFNAQLWAEFDSRPVDRLVVDLRNNTGGNSAVINPFITSGTARQARFETTRSYVIIGRRTFSSGVLAAASLKQGPVVLVGEPTGGSATGYGEVSGFSLPNSRMIVSYSMKYISVPGYPPGSVVPDVAVPIYSSDYFARHDPFLAAVMADAAPALPTTESAVAVLNAASLRPGVPVAPGSLASAFGDFGGVSAADANTVPLPSDLSGAQVFVGSVPAPLIAVRPTQVNFQVPPNVAPGLAPILVTHNGAQVASGTVRVAATGPGLFVADPLNLGRPGAVLDENYRLVGETNPAARGKVVQVYATGQGTSQELPQAFLGSEQAEVVWSGPHPAFPGLWQINVKVPDTAAMSGELPLFVTIGRSASNPVTVRVSQ